MHFKIDSTRNISTVENALIERHHTYSERKCKPNRKKNWTFGLPSPYIVVLPFKSKLFAKSNDSKEALKNRTKEFETKSPEKKHKTMVCHLDALMLPSIDELP